MGVASPVFKLEGFWLLANHRNHCFADAVLQCLRWAIMTLGERVLHEALEVSRLARITPEHITLPGANNTWMVL